MPDIAGKAQRTDLARIYIGIAAQNCALLNPCTFFSLKIEMILFAETEETKLRFFQKTLHIKGV